MKKLFVSFIVFTTLTNVWAQEEKGLNIFMGADWVSSFVWRGSQLAGMSVQPFWGLEISGFSISAWGSVDVEDKYKEVDFTLAYEKSGVSFELIDYWTACGYKYFSYQKDKTGHVLEAKLGYVLPVKSFPLSLSWSTCWAGADLDREGKKEYSTYIEAIYPFSIKEISLEAGFGLLPWKSAAYETDKPAVVNLNLKASKAIKITEHFSLPIFGQIIVNPYREDIFFVFGMNL
jgi:hypothetical protein